MSSTQSEGYGERHSERPGRIMLGEMAEQPAVLRRILADGAPRIREVAAAIAARKPRFVLLTARGTSDNAALYAKYLIEIRLGVPCGLTSMSTITAYGARPDLSDVLVITVSQSGGSPDLVDSTRAARAAARSRWPSPTTPTRRSPPSPSTTSTSWPGPRRRCPRPRRTPPRCSPSISSSRACAAATSRRPRRCPSSRTGSWPGRTR